MGVGAEQFKDLPAGYFQRVKGAPVGVTVCNQRWFVRWAIFSDNDGVEYNGSVMVIPPRVVESNSVENLAGAIDSVLNMDALFEASERARYNIILYYIMINYIISYYSRMEIDRRMDG